MLKRPQVAGKLPLLELELRSVLERPNNQIVSSEELMSIYEGALSECSEWLEIKNELLGLGDNFKVFSALLLYSPEWLDRPFNSKEVTIQDKENYFKKGISVFDKVIRNPDNSYWLDQLASQIVNCSAYEEANSLSTAGSVYIKAEEAFGDKLGKAGFEEIPLFRNGNSAYISKTGDSRVYTRPMSKGEDLWDIKEYTQGDPVDSIYWQGFARTDKYMVKQMRSLSDPSPYHNIIDLEIFGADFKDGQVKLSQNLVDYFSFLLPGKKDDKLEAQHLHVFYRGSHVASIDSNELNNILVNKKRFLDFILKVNFFAYCSSKVDRANHTYHYRYSGPIKNSKSLWVPPGPNGRPARSGTARVLLSNEEIVKSSMLLLEGFIKSHIDVRLLIKLKK